MSITEFIGKFKSKMLWGNLLAMALVIVGLAVGFKFAIDIYTHHGEAVTIPNLTHKTYDNAQEVLSELGLDMVVSDTGYIKTLPPGCILEQYPALWESASSLDEPSSSRSTLPRHQPSRCPMSSTTARCVRRWPN